MSPEWPPTSETWAMLPTNAITRPRRTTGLTMTKSGRWPVPSHGSLVASTSPCASVSTGKRASRCFAVIGSTTQKFGGL